MTTRTLPVPDGLVGERVDVALARLLGFSRSLAAQIAAEGGVRIAGRPLCKSDRLPAEAWLDVDVPDPNHAALRVDAEPVPGMTVRYEDEDVIVIDKPIGVAAHPAPGWDGPTVVGGLRGAGYQIATSGAAERQGIVHRLDAGTSGLMVVAKSEHAYTVMKRAFKERTVTKVYHALVQGHPDPTKGTVDAPIGRHPGRDYRFAVVAGGRPSVTHYEVLEMLPAASLLEIHLETGRTHQIRVHMSALHHPCVGDLTYGADPRLAQRAGLERQWLHAMRLGFAQPSTGERVEVTSEYPADLAAALATLGEGYR